MIFGQNSNVVAFYDGEVMSGIIQKVEDKGVITRFDGGEVISGIIQKIEDRKGVMSLYDSLTNRAILHLVENIEVVGRFIEIGSGSGYIENAGMSGVIAQVERPIVVDTVFSVGDIEYPSLDVVWVVEDIRPFVVETVWEVGDIEYPNVVVESVYLVGDIDYPGIPKPSVAKEGVREMEVGKIVGTIRRIK